MSQVFNQCTCCYRPLTEEEIQKHKDGENFYYTICDDCLKKASERIIKIVKGKRA